MNKKLSAIGVLALLALLAAACGGAAVRSAADHPAAPGKTAQSTRGTVPHAPLSGVATAGGALAAPGFAAEGASAQAAPNDAAAPPVPPLPSSQHLELAGSVQLQMPHNHFQDGYEQVLAIIADEHGYLSSSDSQASGTDVPRSGVFTFQVPVDNFQQTLNRLAGVGRYLGQHTTSKPHDAEYVDLQARLSSAQLQLAALNALLGRATTVGEVLAIEQQVAQVQQQIDEYQGQLRYLDSLTQYSTVTVDLTEKGAAPPAPRPVQDPWGFGATASQVVHNLAAIGNGLVLVLGTLAPFLVVLALAAYGTRRRWLPAFQRA